MANRTTAPNSAFAFITEIKGQKHRLLMHHNPEKVQDGTEHDTVDAGLLKASLNLVDQLQFASEDEREAVRVHLQSHARSIVVDEQPDDFEDAPTRRTRLTSDDGRKIVEQQAGGPSGNQNITSPKVEGELPGSGEPQVRLAEEQLRQESGTGSITSPKSKGTEPGEKGTENPAGTKGDLKETQDEGPTGPDVDTKVKPKGGSTKVSETSEGRGEDPGQHVDNGEQLVNNPNADQQAEVPKSSSKQATARGEPTKKGKEPNKKADPEKEKDKQPAPKGKKVDANNPLAGKPGKKAKERHVDPEKKK